MRSFLSDVSLEEKGMENFVGFGALGEALQALAKENFRKILVVASDGAWRRFNTPSERTAFAGRDVRVFSAFSPNPGFDEIRAGAALAKEFAPDLLLAVGGGSAMDVAKGIKAFGYSTAPYDPPAAGRKPPPPPSSTSGRKRSPSPTLRFSRTWLLSTRS